MSLLERPLDAVESVFAAAARVQTCAVVALVGFTGALDAEICAQALAAMPARHPRLRTRVARSGDAYHFTTANVEPPTLRVIEGCTPEDWPRLLEGELERRMDDTLPSLVGATLARSPAGEGPHALVLWGQHAAFDFQSMVEIACDVLVVAGARMIGQEPPLRARREPSVPLEARLPPAGPPRPPAPPPPPEGALPPFDERASIAARRERVSLLALDAPTVRVLLDRARAAQTTLTGIVAACAFEAARRTWGPLAAMRVGISVGARSLATPRVASDEIGCFVSQLETTESLGGGPFLPWERARAFSSEVRARIERGDWHAAIRGISGNVGAFSRQMDRWAHDEVTLGRTTALDIVSFGALAVPPAPPLRLGPMYGAISNQGFGHCLWLAFGSVDGVLHVTLGSVSPLVSESRARSFLDQLEALLRDATSQR